MVRVVAESNQLQAEIHYLVLHDVHANLFFFSVATCRPNDKKSLLAYPLPGERPAWPPSPASPTPLTHIVLARDVAQDGVALGDLVLAIHEVGQLEGKGQGK